MGLVIVIFLFCVLLSVGMLRLKGEIDILSARVKSLQSSISVNDHEIRFINKALIDHEVKINQIVSQINKSE